ncbi:integrase core domain-containing protein [Verrucomicrobiota bacterium sgz303538]
MSWKTTTPQDERREFIEAHRSGDYSVADLARRFGVSRKTAYKWLDRYKEQSWAGLEERSRAPLSHPDAVTQAIETQVLELKAKWPLWGAPKLYRKLLQFVGEQQCPSESTISRILARHGLSGKCSRRRPVTAKATGTRLGEFTAANAIWCADFKGAFALGNRRWCTPLTISDGFSRYLLRCQGLSKGTDTWIVKPIFEAVFREYGLPEAIRTDNGTPFASSGFCGLTKLSVWWLQLGIRLERSRPGCPQDNGRHERMHRTLKEATATPPRANLRAQQQAFDTFRREYNEERPHEALEGRAPAELYEYSVRRYPERLPECREYPKEWKVRRVRPSGQVKWRNVEVVITKALSGKHIGFEPNGDGLWKVHFNHHFLGEFDERAGRVFPAKTESPQS